MNEKSYKCDMCNDDSMVRVHLETSTKIHTFNLCYNDMKGLPEFLDEMFTLFIVMEPILELKKELDDIDGR